MSRLGNCAALTCASLTFAAGVGSAASAGEECSQHYKICNWSCDRPINAVDNFLVCKSQCDRRLIACDRRPINASKLGATPLPGLTPQGRDLYYGGLIGSEVPPARQSSTTGHDKAALVVR
jgi:hypothetical protein